MTEANTMTEFFANIPLEAATQIEQLSRVAYEMRENRAALLRQYDAVDEAALLERIRSCDVAEHPAYEHYLGARALLQAREDVVAELQVVLEEARATQ